MENYTHFKETEGMGEGQVWEQANSSPQMRCERHLFSVGTVGWSFTILCT